MHAIWGIQTVQYLVVVWYLVSRAGGRGERVGEMRSAGRAYRVLGTSCVKQWRCMIARRGNVGILASIVVHPFRGSIHESRRHPLELMVRIGDGWRSRYHTYGISIFTVEDYY